MTVGVVLAAGLGRRLQAASVLPKWLTPVGVTCPGAVQLEGFERANIERVHVVVSAESVAIEDYLRPWHDRLELEVVRNDHAADRNNWYSLLLGLAAVAERRDSADVLVANSDLFADATWFADLAASLNRTQHPAALAIDPARGRTDEAMKVSLDEDRELVTGIGKVGIDDPGGEYVGLSWWSAGAAGDLRAVLEGFLDMPARADHWYEHAIADHLAAGARYGAVAVPSGAWVEIDDLDDLAEARRLPIGRPGPPGGR